MLSDDKKRGFTVAEVLVAAFISLLLAGVFFSVFVPAMRSSAEGTARLELQQFSVLAFYEIKKELSRTRASALSVGDSALLMHPHIALDSSGQAIWSDQLVLFHLDTANRELGKHEVPSGVVQPSTLTLAELTTLTSALPRAPKVLAHQVSDFQVQSAVPATDTTPATPLRIELILEKDITQRVDPVRVTMTRSFSFRTAD